MKSLGQLVAGVAHELNNPIGFVHANLQLLEEIHPEARRRPAVGERHRAHPRDDQQAARAQPRGHPAREEDRAGSADLLAHGPGRAPGRGPARGDRSHAGADGAALQEHDPGGARLRRSPARALLSRPAQPGVPESADERLRRDRREGRDPDRDAPEPERRHPRVPRQTAPASRPTSRAASSIRSSPPSRWASAPASASRSRTASSSATAVGSASNPNPAAGRPSWSTCRSTRVRSRRRASDRVPARGRTRA